MKKNELMCDINIIMSNNISMTYNINNIAISNETSPFMIEYYSKRMKMWHPYADIPLNDDMSNNIDILIKAIEHIENKYFHLS